MRTWLLALLLGVTGCTSAPSAAPPTPQPTREATPTAPADALGDLRRSGPPRIDVVRGHVLHRTDGTRLRIRLGLRGRWGITSLVPEGDDYLVTDDRVFEGSVGMHRVDARGRAVADWATTGPAVRGPGDDVAWVSMVAPESGESGPTEIHTSGDVQAISPLIMPSISGYDGQGVTFTALQQEGRRYFRRAFTTDLVGAPRRVPMPPARALSPDGQHWWVFRGRSLVIGGAGGEVELRARPFLQGFGQPAWEDDSHLLVTVGRGRRHAIGRIDLAGELTLAGDWSPRTNAGFAFVAPPPT